jgi:3-oxoacyl-[acyl-carrier-protein] synthase I
MSLSTLGQMWQRLSAAAPQEPQRYQPLVVASAGLCCAVGYSLEPASAAIRASMDHFQHSQFKTGTGRPVLAALLPERRLWGGKRLAKWLQLALQDCLANTDLAPQRLALLWLAPDRPEHLHAATVWDEVYTQTCANLDLKGFHPGSGVLASGRAGLSIALDKASRLLRDPSVEGVLLAGVDSLLDAATISRLLQEERLLVEGNADGFIPGEAAAAVLLQRRTAKPGELLVMGHAQDLEPGRVDGSVPSRAQGLTNALRGSLAQSGLDYHDLEFRCTDQNGEAFYAKEASNAMTRLAPIGGEALPLITLADSVGEVGAAWGPLMLAYLFNAMRHPLGPGPSGLLHLASDDGRRCAAVLALETE